ncbi:MAG: hypothetical protein ACU83N_00750 [Gammaproteobacteria bacterium]
MIAKKMKDAISKYWEHCVAIIIPLMISAAMAYAFLSEESPHNTVKYSNEMLLGAIILLALFFVLIFQVYRIAVINKIKQEINSNEDSVSEWKDVSYKRFAIPLSLLVSTILLISGGLMYWDGTYSHYDDSELKNLGCSQIDISNKFRCAGYGMSWLMVGNYLALPSSVIEWSFLGALIYILQDMLKRFIAFDLNPRFYLLGTVRIIMAISASITVFTILQAEYHLFEFDFSANGVVLKTVRPNENAFSSNGSANEISRLFWLLPMSFIAGMFPVQTLTSIKNATSVWFSDRLSNLTGSFGKIFQSKNLIIELSHIIPNEAADRLKEEGIYCIQDLAAVDIYNLGRQVPFHITKLIDWQDRAMLLCTVGKSNIERLDNDQINDFEILSRNGFNRFSDLYYLYELKEKNIDAFNDFKQKFKSPILLEVLAKKGEAIYQKLQECKEKDIRIAAFQVWYLSPSSFERHMRIR